MRLALRATPSGNVTATKADRRGRIVDSEAKNGGISRHQAENDPNHLGENVIFPYPHATAAKAPLAQLDRASVYGTEG
jgi:hypothetical protein